MGKFSDKFLNAFSLDDDEDFDDYDDDFEDDYEEKSSGIFKKKQKSQSDDEETAPVKSVSKKSTPISSKISGQQEVCVIKPSSIEDSREISETLLSGKAVIINFEGLHVEISQRIMDFVSGTCYAIDGNLQKVSNFIFIATPNSVDISGDFQELVEGGDNTFDISGFKSPLL